MIKRVLLIIIGLYVLSSLGFYLFQKDIIFRPKKLSKNHTFVFDKNFEEVNLTTNDNSTINALHFKIENSKGVIIYFHGNKGNLSRWGKIVSRFTNYGYDVFVLDYRGYGKSTGKRTEVAMYDDAQLCYDYIHKLYDENTIVIYGRSIGGTFAAYVASLNDPKLLILEATFNSMTDVVNNIFPMLPNMLIKFKFETYRIIPKVKAETIIFHGNKDELVSIDLGKKLYNYSDKKHTRFIEIDGATHHNIAEFEKYKNTLKTVLK
jgi:alpha-beta hydrolase superfamily lysophospholipase